MRRDDIGEGLRAHPVGRRVIYYRENADILEVVRVLHGSMDEARHLGQGRGRGRKDEPCGQCCRGLRFSRGKGRARLPESSGLAGPFLASLLAATPVPTQSESALVGLLALGADPWWLLPAVALAGHTPAEADASGQPVDMMDKAGALPTSPQPQQQQREEGINRFLAT